MQLSYYISCGNERNYGLRRNKVLSYVENQEFQHSEVHPVWCIDNFRLDELSIKNDTKIGFNSRFFAKIKIPKSFEVFHFQRVLVHMKLTINFEQVLAFRFLSLMPHSLSKNWNFMYSLLGSPS